MPIVSSRMPFDAILEQVGLGRRNLQGGWCFTDSDSSWCQKKGGGEHWLSRGASGNREIRLGEAKILREFGLLRLICALLPKRRPVRPLPHHQKTVVSLCLTKEAASIEE